MPLGVGHVGVGRPPIGGWGRRCSCLFPFLPLGLCSPGPSPTSGRPCGGHAAPPSVPSLPVAPDYTGTHDASVHRTEGPMSLLSLTLATSAETLSPEKVPGAQALGVQRGPLWGTPSCRLWNRPGSPIAMEAPVISDPWTDHPVMSPVHGPVGLGGFAGRLAAGHGGGRAPGVGHPLLRAVPSRLH